MTPTPCPCFWSGGPWATIATRWSKAHAEGALEGSARVFVGLSAIPTGNVHRVEKLEMKVAVVFDLGEDVWRFAATSFVAYAVRRRPSGGETPKCLPADFVIAPHAPLKADRLMTRDANR